MRFVQITPGAGAMYCGNCLRDNALVAALRQLGHDAVMLPVYLPLTLDEADQSAGLPVFFGGINVFLQQQASVFAAAPNWFRNLMSSRPFLQMAAGRAAKTRAAEVGALTESMLRGETGRQRRELQELATWLRSQPRPDVVSLSNGLLLGMAPYLARELPAKVACTLQGEDGFLDALNEPYRTRCWQLMSERARAVDVLIAPSRYFAELMTARLGLPPGKIQIVPNGIDLAGYGSGVSNREGPPTIGYFARMCPEKGLDLLVDAWVALRSKGLNLRLKVGGSCGPADQPFVDGLQRKIADAGPAEAAEFSPNLDRAAKIRFLKSLTVFSVPARCSEAFGLYLVEAMAAGVPVVQPASSAFPEIVEGHGVLYTPNAPSALAAGLEELVGDPARAKQLGARAAETARLLYTSQRMASGVIELVGNPNS